MPPELSKRCQRCYERHRRCDRQHPQCGACRLAEEACCYERVPRAKRGEPPTYQRQISVIDFRKQKLFSNLPILHLLLRIPSRSFVVGTVTLLQFPSVHVPGLKAFISACLHMCTGLARNRHRLLPAPATVSREVLRQGEEAFFRHANPFLGLFTRQALARRPPSALLAKVIALCGLHFCSSASQPARDALFDELGTLFVPGRLPLSVDTLQTTVVLLVGLAGTRWVLRRIGFLCAFAGTVAHAIGLHRPTGSRERRMLANSLAYYLNHTSISKSPVAIALPRQEPHSGREQVHVSARLFWSLNAILPRLLSLRNAIVDSPTPPADAEPRILAAEARLATIKQQFLEQLPPCQVKQPTFFIYSFYFAYYGFVTATMRLYRSTTNLVPLCLPPPSRADTRKAVDGALFVLRWGTLVPPSYAHWYYVIKLTHCLVFLSRHRQRLAPPELALLTAATAHLRQLNLLPYLGSVTFFLAFIEKVHGCPALF